FVTKSRGVLGHASSRVTPVGYSIRAVSLTGMPHDHAVQTSDHQGEVNPRPRGRPRSDRAHQAIIDAALQMLIDEGFADLALERVAACAGVGKATIYRRWASKEALALDLLMQLASPHITIEDVGDTRAELLSAVTNALHAVNDTPFGPVIRALLSQIAINPLLGDPFRASVVQARRAEIARVVARGVDRGDL